MSTSDFIVVISIIFTLIAIVVSNNKQLWVYKFGKLEIFLSIIYVIVVNILILGDFEFRIDEIKGCCCCYSDCCDTIAIKSKTIAYIITIILFGVMIWYVGWSKRFPRANVDKIIRYYKGLITNNIALLIADLQNYHEQAIENHIKRINKYYENYTPPQTAMEETAEIEKARRRAHRNQSLTKKVLAEIIMDKQFIQKSIDVDPLFCLKFYSCLTTTRYYDDRIEFYFTKLIESKRSEFINELIDIDIYNTATTFEKKLNETQFLKLIFSKNCTATLFRTNYLFGEAALREIHSGCEIFGKEETEWLESDYKRTICYQFVRYYSISSLYIQQDYLKDKKERPYKDIYNEYCNYLTQDMLKCYGSCGKKTFAQRFVKDISELKPNSL